MTITKGAFYCEEQPFFVGYSYGRTWNGWECPLFTKQIIKKIMEYVNQDGSMELTYNKENDTFIEKTKYFDGEIEETIYEPTYIEYNGKKLKVYPIGDGWVWQKKGGK